MSPLDPLTFLRIAQELGARRGEAELRTAVGRAYYALFLIARGKTGVVGTHDVHRAVIVAVRGMGYWLLASELDNLRKLRIVADYQLLPADPRYRNWHQNWARAERIVKRILPDLQVL